MRFYSFLFFFLPFSGAAGAQTFVTKDVKSFGAKGDGKTNDHEAFKKAADFFNKRGGNGKLVIPKGIYIIGKQTFTQGINDKPAYEGDDVLRFANVANLTVEGTGAPVLKYPNGLRFGAFDPQTGKPHQHPGGYFADRKYAAHIGHCIVVTHSKNVIIKNLELSGNNQNVVLGGSYGDVGRQLQHYGLFIENSKSITVDGIKAHHFALDGISVANKASDTKDDIKLLNSVFEYNSRQGLSWIGGNELKVKKCKFNHTGQGKFDSPPGAGVDVEAEYGPIRNGEFEDREFINNKGCGFLADSGDSGNSTVKNSTIWGTDAWSVWITKPGYTFTNCKIYGSIIHGYNSPNDKDATKYIQCHFEDKPYNGKEAFGGYLVESNDMRRVSFTGCTFVSNKKKLLWIATNPKLAPEEKYQFNKCNFVINNTNLPQGDFAAVIRGLHYKNCTFTFTGKDAKKKGYWLNECCEAYNVDGGGNKVVFL